MFNFRWGIISGAAAFALSIGIGLTSGANIAHLLIRALIFGAVFFGFGFGVWILINSFIPELLQENYGDEEGGAAPPGSRINITLDDRNFARPEQYRDPQKPDEVGNITDLISGKVKLAAAPPPVEPAGGIDQNLEDRYNEVEGGGLESINQEQSGQGAQSAAAFTPAFGSDEGLGGLPDLDALAGAFLTNAGDEARPSPLSGAGQGPAPAVAAAVSQAAPVQAAAEPPQRKSTSGKPTPLQGDFNPKDLAEGIRTILNKDT